MSANKGPPGLSKIRRYTEDLRKMRDFAFSHKNENKGAGASSYGDVGIDDGTPFGKIKCQLMARLKALRIDIDRECELKANADGKRDPVIIKLHMKNSNELKSCIAMWNDLKKHVSDKSVDKKTLQYHNEYCGILGVEIKDLCNKHAYAKMTADEEDIEKRKVQREERRLKRLQDQQIRKERRRRRTGSECDDDNNDEKENNDGVQMTSIKTDPVEQKQELEFMKEMDANFKEQDEMLDVIMTGLNELHDIAKNINVQLDVGKELLNELETKIDKQNARLKAVNNSLVEILQSTGGCARWAPILICFILIIALVGAIVSAIG